MIIPGLPGTGKIPNKLSSFTGKYFVNHPVCYFLLDYVYNQKTFSGPKL